MKVLANNVGAVEWRTPCGRSEPERRLLWTAPMMLALRCGGIRWLWKWVNLQIPS